MTGATVALNLTSQRCRLFRITHIANLPWLLRHGLYCAESTVTDPNFVAIGNPDLINKRADRRVPIAPGGTLSNYIPFYYTPKSPMLLNIKTGYKGIRQRSNDDIVILVSSCDAMATSRVPMVFTDRHAVTATARWSGAPEDLATIIDWDILNRHDFARDDSYPDKMERYQAEALAYRHVPLSAILGMGCSSQATKSRLEDSIRSAGLVLQVALRPAWYF